MKIYVLLNTFSEREDWLEEMIFSLAPLSPDRIIACDGAYEHFNSERRYSPPTTLATIYDASWRVGASMAITFHDGVGDEVAKRQHLLDLALGHAPDEDAWIFVCDSDYLLERCEGVREALERTDLLAAHVSFYEGRCADGTPGSYPARLLMRATPGMRMGRAHYLYELPDGRHHHILGRDSTVPALDLTDRMLVHHRVHSRDEERRDKQRAYYHERDTRDLES